MNRWVALLSACLFAVGVGLGAWLASRWRSPAPPVWPSPVTPAPVASPTAAPVLTAQAGTVTRVTIRRPVGPGLGERPDGSFPSAAPGAPAAPTGQANPGFEVIDVVVQASAVAAVAEPSAALVPTPGPWGLVVGTQPGLVGLGYEAITWSGVGGLPVRVGVAGVLSPQAVGAGGNLGLEAGLPRLYLTAGAAQRFGQPFDPAPYVGLGWRL